MGEDITPNTPPAPQASAPLPQGYRQGIITAITVLLGFSLAFFRFWGFEAAGQWTWYSAFSTGALAVSVVLQIVALFRSLRIEDDDAREYRKTVNCFIVSVCVMLVALVFAVIEYGVVSHA
jgi:hypothetical protein